MSFDIPDTKPIDPGTYKAQLLGTAIKTGGEFGDFRTWDWLVEMPDGTTANFSDSTSLNNGPQSKAYARLTALLGAAPQAGSKVDDPTGKTVILTIGKKENGFPKIDGIGPYVAPVQTEAGLPR